jgi:hypothetical protein
MRGLANLQRLDRETAVHALLFAILVLALPLGLASSPRIFNDGDVSWHLASGAWMLGHGRIPTTDPFSLTVAGHPWTAMEWLADLIFASAFRLAGYAGVTTIVAAVMIALHALLFFYLQRRVGPVAMVATLLVLDFVLMPFTLARPHVLVWPLLAAWTILLLEASERERVPPLWAALVLTVWTNLHASFPIALPIGAAIAFDALQKTGWRNWREWARFALASLIAILLNANGIRGLSQPFHIAGLAMLPLINEWQPSTLSWTPQFYVALGIGLSVLLYKGVRVPLGRLVLLLVLGALAFSQVRHQSWFIVTACCVVPPLVGSRPSQSHDFRWLAFTAIPLLLVRSIWPITPDENAASPRHLIAAIPGGLRNQPVFNGYTFGGPLILAGIRPYIDGRADMYGDAFVLDYSRIMDGDLARFDAAVKRYDIRWTMLPANSRLAQQLDSSGSWIRIYSDRVGAIHVRRGVRSDFSLRSEAAAAP